MKKAASNRFRSIIIFFGIAQIVPAASLPDTMLAGMWNFSLSRLRATMTALGNNTTAFPRSAAQTGGTWGTVGAADWTSGFYPGCLWLAFEKSGDTLFRYNAQRWTSSLYGQRSDASSHDVGFEIFTSYGNGYRLLGTASYLPVILTAAQTLTTRYRPLAGIIDCWSFAPYDTGWEEIIDCMMNLELLFWASQNGAGQSYYDTALSHATKAMTYHFRSDSSTYHVVRYSRTNGAMISQETRQGYSNSSCWARGQAWAIHGFTMAYRFTKNTNFLLSARKAADYFVRHLPADRIPYWDFQAPGAGGAPDTTPRDVSAAAIAASGMLELSTFVGQADSACYRDSAISILRGIWTPKYRGLVTQASILNHATGDRPRSTEVDVGLVYADYYFLQALLRYEKNTPTITRNYAMPSREPRHNTPQWAPNTCNLIGRSIRSCSGPPSPVILIQGQDKNRPVSKGHVEIR